MSGPEHYREAEQSLKRARQARQRLEPEAVALWLAEAGVHAQLARVQAAILPEVVEYLDGAARMHLTQEWIKVARPPIADTADSTSSEG